MGVVVLTQSSVLKRLIDYLKRNIYYILMVKMALKANVLLTTLALLFSSIMCVDLYGATPPTSSRPVSQPAQVVHDINGDVHIRTPTLWKDGHYRIRGSIILESGGLLEVRRCTVELLSSYSREFAYRWRGGRLVSIDSTLGGTKTAGTYYHSNFELRDGEWKATNTTIRYCYGITFGSGATVGRLRATNLIQGPGPDSVIMSGRGDVVIKDSTYAIALHVYADKGGKATLNLPTDRPLTKVFDGSVLPGVKYRLELINTRVSLWFLFFSRVSLDGPPTEITLGHCPRIIPSISGCNLGGSVHLPETIGSGKAGQPVVQVGNLTLKAVDVPIKAIAWGVYLWGSKTDLTLTGPTRICELMLRVGRATVVGEPGTYNACLSATTIEVGRDGPDAKPAELIIRHASLGRFGKQDPVRGQITAHGNSRINIEHARCSNLILMTKGKGIITAGHLIKQGSLTKIEQGGPIRLSNQIERNRYK